MYAFQGTQAPGGELVAWVFAVMADEAAQLWDGARLLLIDTVSAFGAMEKIKFATLLISASKDQGRDPPSFNTPSITSRNNGYP